jgi:hypothetical protein
MEFKFKEIDQEKGRAIVKVSIGDYYLITKCGTLAWVDSEMRSVYRKYVHKMGVPETNLFLPLIEVAYKKELKYGKIEVLFQTTNGYELLKKELELLMEHFGKRNCKNTNNIPYIPKTVHANKGSNWLKQNEYLNFMRLLKNYDF